MALLAVRWVSSAVDLSYAGLPTYGRLFPAAAGFVALGWRPEQSRSGGELPPSGRAYATSRCINLRLIDAYGWTCFAAVSRTLSLRLTSQS